jgi:prepilin-type N-terminal cleavage/methylation domain-containing protein
MRRGFSLIELLVAMTVLAILLVLLAQIFSMVSNTWRAGRSQVDNFAQARVALDVIGRDVESAVLRPDLPAFFVDSVPQFAFHTRQQSLVTETNSGNRPLCRVMYGVTNGTEGCNLRRSAHGYNFGEDVGYSPTNWSVSGTGLVFDSDIGPGVLVIRQQFMGTNGRNVLPEQIQASWTNVGTNAGVGALRAVTISLAVVDKDAVQILVSSGKLQQFQSNFSSADPGAVRSYASAWQEQLDDASAPLANGGIPPRILRSLRIFERTITLPTSRE